MCLILHKPHEKIFMISIIKLHQKYTETKFYCNNFLLFVFYKCSEKPTILLLRAMKERDTLWITWYNFPSLDKIRDSKMRRSCHLIFFYKNVQVDSGEKHVFPRIIFFSWIIPILLNGSYVRGQLQSITLTLINCSITSPVWKKWTSKNTWLAISP